MNSALDPTLNRSRFLTHVFVTLAGVAAVVFRPRRLKSSERKVGGGCEPLVDDSPSVSRMIWLTASSRARLRLAELQESQTS